MDHEKTGFNLSTNSCEISAHLCGEPCHLRDREGCLKVCSKVVISLSSLACPHNAYYPSLVADWPHWRRAHMSRLTRMWRSEIYYFSSRVFRLMPSQPCSLMNIALPDGTEFSCPEHCRKPRYDQLSFGQLSCTKLGLIPAMSITMNTFVKLAPAQSAVNFVNDFVQVPTTYTHWTRMRYIYAGKYWTPLDHGKINWNSSDRQEHPCPASCQSQGICRIETAPQSVEATFTGRHETFQYTKVGVLLLFSIWYHISLP